VGLFADSIATMLCVFALQQADGSVAAPAATPPDVKALVDRMQSFYEGTQDFTASFRQDYTYKAFKRTQTSTGRVLFKKPGLMRWEYEKPAPKTFVLNGDKVYAHDPQAMLLTKSSIDTSQLSASVTFLFGTGKLDKEFTITRVDCADCKGTLLELNPKKPDPRFKKVRLEVDPKTAQVIRSIVFDPNGDQNSVTFLDLKTNTGLSREAFVLTPPAGTQVQDLSLQPPRPKQ
jgi:outer membrane lipoprotein carrier protein